MFEIIIQFLIGVLTPIIFIGGIIAVLNELIQSFEKKEEYNRKLEELEEEIKEFSSQNQTLVEDCKSTPSQAAMSSGVRSFKTYSGKPSSVRWLLITSTSVCSDESTVLQAIG